MRPVDISRYTDNQVTYRPYGAAKEDLIQALGPFCSFCEREGFSSALDVEHIENKNQNPGKENDWDNFLLGCKNCNPIKGTKSVTGVLLPHQDNTFAAFLFLESGLIAVNPAIDHKQKTKAEKLIDLVGLDRRPGHNRYSTKDKRWEERMKAWTLANRYLDKFSAGHCDIEIIKDLALSVGFWSVWMTVFDDQPEIKMMLVNVFQGTRIEYFM